MKKKIIILFLVVGILAMAGVFRFMRIGERPMHTDEAVQAIKCGMLLETGEYRYDREEYHGPTLNYLTLPVALIRGEKDLSRLGESTVRLVPAIIGVLTILLLFLLWKDLGWAVVLLAALITSISPAMAYYSRYYIHETLLVFFAFGTITGWIRMIRTRKTWWALFTGLFLGLMLATKETWVLSLGTMFIAGSLLAVSGRKISPEEEYLNAKLGWWHAAIPLGTAVLVAALFYSSFFSNPAGLKDALGTFATYLDRAGHDPDHLHSWHYYPGLLIFRSSGDGIIWSEAWIVVAALVGGVMLLVPVKENKHSMPIVAFIGVYSFLLVTGYSAIPYKTPWNLLNFYQPMILIAAFGMVHLYKRCKGMPARSIVAGLAGLLVLFTVWQTWHTVTDRATDPDNPFVYAHPTYDVIEIVDQLDELAAAHPDGKGIFIEVVFSDHEYWPLPWYLRDFTRIGWWDSVDLESRAAPVVLASADMEGDLLTKWYEIPEPGQRNMYIPMFDKTMEIRHGVEIRGYIRKDLFDTLSSGQ